MLRKVDVTASDSNRPTSPASSGVTQPIRDRPVEKVEPDGRYAVHSGDEFYSANSIYPDFEALLVGRVMMTLLVEYLERSQIGPAENSSKRGADMSYVDMIRRQKTLGTGVTGNRCQRVTTASGRGVKSRHQRGRKTSPLDISQDVVLQFRGQLRAPRQTRSEARALGFDDARLNGTRKRSEMPWKLLSPAILGQQLTGLDGEAVELAARKLALQPRNDLAACLVGEVGLTIFAAWALVDNGNGDSPAVRRKSQRRVDDELRIAEVSLESEDFGALRRVNGCVDDYV